MSKILLVEDDNNLREIYEARLHAEGYTIVSAKDGEEALSVAKEEKPDLVISDVMMPKISGFEMLDILRNTDQLKNIKVIMLTALGQQDDQQRANKLGADKYLVKSQVTLEDIVKTAHELLGDLDQSANVNPTTTAASQTPPTQTTPVGATDTATVPSVLPTPISDQPEPVQTPPVSEAKDSQTLPTAFTTPTSVTNSANVNSLPSSNVNESSQQAQSSTQESASINTEIENFVAGAGSNSTIPPVNNAVTPEASPMPVANPSSSNTVSPASGAMSNDQKAANASIDDGLMSKAADSLMGEPQLPANNTGTIGSPETPEVKADPSATPISKEEIYDGADKDIKNDVPKNDNVSIANKKVIAPPSESNKPDIQTLYELEEIQNGTSAPPTVEPPAIVSNGNSATSSTNITSPINNTSVSSDTSAIHTNDPNNISL